MLVIEMDDINGILEEAKKTPKMVVYIDNQYSQSIKEPEIIIGSLVVATITKIHDETTIYFYEEEITTNKKTEQRFEEKCKEERDLCIETLKKNGYNIKIGIIKQGG